MPVVVYFTASDAARVAHGELTPAAFRLAAKRGDLRTAAKTAGGIMLFSRDGILAFLAQRDARRHARGAAT
jgi:hypothetical protein